MVYATNAVSNWTAFLKKCGSLWSRISYQEEAFILSFKPQATSVGVRHETISIYINWDLWWHAYCDLQISISSRFWSNGMDQII